MLKQILFVFEFISMFQICNSFNAKHQHDDLRCNDSTSINLTQNNIFEFDPLEVHRRNFLPDGFVFETASAACQVHVYSILSVQSVEICITYVREIKIKLTSWTILCRLKELQRRVGEVNIVSIGQYGMHTCVWHDWKSICDPMFYFFCRWERTSELGRSWILQLCSLIPCSWKVWKLLVIRSYHADISHNMNFETLFACLRKGWR